MALWEFGEATIKDLAEAFEITESGLKKGLKARGSVKGSRAHEVGNAVAEQAKTDAAKRVQRIGEMKEKYIGWSDLISKLTMKEIGDAVKAKVPLGSKKENLVALNKAASTVSKMRDENFHLFGLYDENPDDEELPELVIGEYSAEEIEQIQSNFDQIEEELNAALGDDTEEEEDDDDAGVALVLPFEEEDDD